jgi:hypothetical protein
VHRCLPHAGLGPHFFGVLIKIFPVPCYRGFAVRLADVAGIVVVSLFFPVYLVAVLARTVKRRAKPITDYLKAPGIAFGSRFRRSVPNRCLAY